jgi:hypothetical protein
VDAESVIKRFVACEGIGGILLREMLIQVIVGFSKTKGRFRDGVLAVSNRCLLKVDTISLPLFWKSLRL